MRLFFLVQAFACICLSSNILHPSFATSPKAQGQESPLNQKTVAEDAQTPKSSRQIKLSSLVNPDKKDYKAPVIGLLTPKKFQIFINGEEIEDNSTKSISIIDNQLVVRRVYTFEYTMPWIGTKIAYSGEREFIFQLSSEHQSFTLDYDWLTNHEVEAHEKTKDSPIKTRMQFIISNATYLKGHLQEEGSKHA